jgi:esterase/lipase superfamily enzyme
VHVGDALHEPEVYFNSPVDYLKNLEDSHYLEAYRNSTIIIACGQGAYEADAMADTRHLEWVLQTKNIPAWVDFWGEDVHHDWVWWRKMMPYYVGKLEEFGVIGTR